MLSKEIVRLLRASGVFTGAVTLFVVMVPYSVHATTVHEMINSAKVVAPDVGNWLGDGTLYGKLGTTTFITNYDGPKKNRYSSTVGGTLQYLSPHFHHFKFGMSGFVQENLGLSPRGARRIQKIGNNAVSLAKLFVQYDYHGFSAKAGRFGMHTPFARENRGVAFLPLTYEGIGTRYHTQLHAWKLNFYGYRIARFKPYDSSTFVSTDTGYPRTLAAVAPETKSAGFWAAGTRIANGGYKLQAWWYKFFRRANLGFVGLHVPMHVLDFSRVKPYVNLRYLKEWDTNNQVPFYRHVNASAYNVDVGFTVPHNNFRLVWYLAPRHKGAYRGGAYLSPYQYTGYDHMPFSIHGIDFSFNTPQQPGYAAGFKDTYIYKKWFATGGYVYAKRTGISAPRGAQNRQYIGYAVIRYRFTPHISVKLVGAYVKSDSKVTKNFNEERVYLTYWIGRRPASVSAY